MAIEIVDFPIKHGGSFHGKMLVHQRVPINNGDSPVRYINQRLNNATKITMKIPIFQNSPQILPFSMTKQLTMKS